MNDETMNTFISGKAAVGHFNGDFVEDNSMVYVKKWIRTRHAILFRLSNRFVLSTTTRAV
jgi:hypothetical protein